MKIKFIMPYSGDAEKSLITNYDFMTKMFFPSKLKNMESRMPFMSLAFPLLAALTPADIEVEILDECVDVIDYDDKVDIVALTAMTYMAPYAYRMASEFKKRGVYVVIGGVHVSLMAEEALRYVDTVFVGEGENSWQQFLEDFRQHKPQQIYREKGIVDLATLPLPRWDLVKNKHYWPYFIQASRGCCFKCDFCQIHHVFGNEVRYKPPQMVLEEIKQLKSFYTMEFWGGNPIIFSDDNIIAHVPSAKKLFEALIPLKQKWSSLCSTNVAKSESLVDLMVASGCDHLFIGYETISQESLNLVNKGHVNKVDQYKKDLDMLHRKGINISSLMMYGMDGDSTAIFRETVKFVDDTCLDFPLFHTLMPLPGTKLTQSLEEQKRVLTYDWAKYTGYYSCIVPSKMTAQQLEQGNDWSTAEVYTEKAILDRMYRLYDLGALRGEKLYFFTRLYMTYRLIKEMFIHKGPLRRFIGKMAHFIWVRPYSKLSIPLLFIDHFAFAQKIPPTEDPAT